MALSGTLLGMMSRGLAVFDTVITHTCEGCGWTITVTQARRQMDYVMCGATAASYTFNMPANIVFYK